MASSMKSNLIRLWKVAKTSMTNSNLPAHFDGEVDLGVIGGTGLYKLDGLEQVAVLPEMQTPWGRTSSPITISKVTHENNTPLYVAFIARHGIYHQYSPSKVPYRANIGALKHLRCKAVLSFSAVGSLQSYIKPRDFVLPQQIIDRTKSIRHHSYFNDEGLVGHVMFGDPFSRSFADYIQQFHRVLTNPESTLPCLLHHDRELTVVCMEGPQFSTRAESRMYRNLGGHVINMSVLPEAKLARECELPYQIVCMATDYDAWKEHEKAVSVETVIGHLSNNSRNANALTSRLVQSMAHELPEFMKSGDGLRGTVRFSISTKPEAMSKETLQKLRFLFPDW